MPRGILIPLKNLPKTILEGQILTSIRCQNFFIKILKINKIKKNKLKCVRCNKNGDLIGKKIFKTSAKHIKEDFTPLKTT